MSGDGGSKNQEEVDNETFQNASTYGMGMQVPCCLGVPIVTTSLSVCLHTP